jgi:hypothetical protein
VIVALGDTSPNTVTAVGRPDVLPASEIELAIVVEIESG